MRELKPANTKAENITIACCSCGIKVSWQIAVATGWVACDEHWTYKCNVCKRKRTNCGEAMPRTC